MLRLREVGSFGSSSNQGLEPMEEIMQEFAPSKGCKRPIVEPDPVALEENISNWLGCLIVFLVCR